MKPASALLALAALLGACPAMAADTYASVAAWNDDATTLGFQIEAFDKCRGRLAEKPRFSGCIQMWEDAYRRWSRMDAYAKARLAKDAADSEAMALAGRSAALGGRLDAASAFVQPELRKLGRQKVEQLIASQKQLSKYREPLGKVLRAAPASEVDPKTLWKG